MGHSSILLFCVLLTHNVFAELSTRRKLTTLDKPVGTNGIAFWAATSAERKLLGKKTPELRALQAHRAQLVCEYFGHQGLFGDSFKTKTFWLEGAYAQLNMVGEDGGAELQGHAMIEDIYFWPYRQEKFQGITCYDDE